MFKKLSKDEADAKAILLAARHALPMHGNTEAYRVLNNAMAYISGPIIFVGAPAVKHENDHFIDYPGKLGGDYEA